MQISGVRVALAFSLLLLNVALFTGCTAADNVAEARKENGANLLEIHLVEQITTSWPPTNEAQLQTVKPHLRPVLADSDFVSFDTTNHTFVLRADTAKRLAHRIWSSATKNAKGFGDTPPPVPGGQIELLPVSSFGEPFVLTVSGVPIYAGRFYTTVSSMSFSGPVIIAEDYAMKTNAPADATFTYRIEAGYPGGGFNPPDPRTDKRIVAAVEKLFKNK
jgi:hypothetical protein